MLAAGLNPVDVAICAGRFYAGKPPLPSVAGREGVGMLDGERVYFDAPIVPFGSMAERALVDPSSTYPVPEGLDQRRRRCARDLRVGGVACAHLARRTAARASTCSCWRASGVLGRSPCRPQSCSARLVLLPRRARRRAWSAASQLGADAAVRLGEPEDLPAALAEAADGRIDVVVDPLFGEPFVAAVNAASFGARLVQLGAGAGAEATLGSAAIRGKLLVIMGHANFAAPPEVKREAYRRLAEAAAAGEDQRGRRADPRSSRWPRPGIAWPAGSHRKIVLVP